MKTVFISYRHEDQAHSDAVRQLAEEIRDAGLSIEFDQFLIEQRPGGPDEGWPDWCTKRMLESECVFVVASKGWFDAYKGCPETDVGKGAASEAYLLKSVLWNNKGHNPRIRFVVLKQNDTIRFPSDLTQWHRFEYRKDFNQMLAWANQRLSQESVAKPHSAPRPPMTTAPLKLSSQPESQQGYSLRRDRKSAMILALALSAAIGAIGLFVLEIIQWNNRNNLAGTKLPKLFTVPEVGIELKWVEPGISMVGSNNEADSNSVPPIKAEISYDFWMGIYEITQGEYSTFMTDSSLMDKELIRSNSEKGKQDDSKRRPAGSVTWRQAVQFCEKLTEWALQEGHIPKGYQFRLPTEIEWEFVCRAGDRSTPNVATPNLLGQGGWTKVDFNNRAEESQMIGLKAPNAWGFYDMLGNVSEHCLDTWWSYTAHEGSSIRDWATIATNQPTRMTRGGSFLDLPEHTTFYGRSGEHMDEQNPTVGFRIVLSEEKIFPRESLSLTYLKKPVLDDDLEITMFWVPPGQFLMGEDDLNSPRGATVSPRVSVNITKGYWMSRTEVTTHQWNSVMKTDSRSQPNNTKNPTQRSRKLPISEVSWIDATRFCFELNKIMSRELPEGYAIRLPTEAEWDWACRAGIETPFHWGTKTNYLDQIRYVENSDAQPGEVKGKTSGPMGMFGMYGNVKEWCLDDEYVYTGKDLLNPLGKATEGERRPKSIRGGDFTSNAELCTGTVRSFEDPDFKSETLGFRFVMGPTNSFTMVQTKTHED